ncbi:MAG: hypothetical protein NTV22_02185 [bacterium]|nr:hypothetical protein [bacterium]
MTCTPIPWPAALAQAAAARGLAAFAVTDHGPGLPQGPHLYHFLNQHRLAKMALPCCVLTGVEDDLAGPNGAPYLPDSALRQLDVVLLGPHPYAWCGTVSPQAITTGLLRAMENPRIKGITHPVNAWQMLDVKQIVQQAFATNTAVELNLTKITGMEQRLRQFLDWVNEFNAPLMINSDAHCADEVGCFDGLVPFLDQIEPARVVNRTLATVVAFFDIQRADVCARCAPPSTSTAEINA